MSPLTSAISACFLSWLTREVWEDISPIVLIQTKKLEDRSTHVWVFSLPWSHNRFRFRAVEAQWNKRWPANLADRVQFPLENPTVNGIPLHIAFHYVSPPHPPHRPDLTEILLKRMQKCKSSVHLFQKDYRRNANIGLKPFAFRLCCLLLLVICVKLSNLAKFKSHLNLR